MCPSASTAPPKRSGRSVSCIGFGMGPSGDGSIGPVTVANGADRLRSV